MSCVSRYHICMLYLKYNWETFRDECLENDNKMKWKKLASRGNDWLHGYEMTDMFAKGLQQMLMK